MTKRLSTDFRNIPRLSAIHTRPDGVRRPMQIAERFELPGEVAESPFFPEYVQEAAKEAMKVAIAKYERLKGWKWLDKRGVELDKSELQIDLDYFGTNEEVGAVNPGHLLHSSPKGALAFVVKMWFEVPAFAPNTLEILDEPDELEDAGLVAELPKPGTGKIVEIE